LKFLELEVSDIPNLRVQKRKGVINTLAVAGEKGSCSELVIILKKSPLVKAYGLERMKINQSKEFANTRNSNEEVIRFAIRKLEEKGCDKSK
jgi:hypothetical protein